MENNKKINAMVVSPAKDAHMRKAKGFSLGEVQEAGKSVELLKKLKIDIDYFRKSKNATNIEALKKIKDIGKKVKQKKPYEAKEKKRTPFKPKTLKPKKKVVEKVVVKKPAKSAEKTPTVKKERVKKEPKPSKKEISTAETTALTSLSGLGPATAKKFEALGVSCAEELINEDSAELASLIKGVSEERISNWIEECKELLK